MFLYNKPAAFYARIEAGGAETTLAWPASTESPTHLCVERSEPGRVIPSTNDETCLHTALSAIGARSGVIPPGACRNESWDAYSGLLFPVCDRWRAIVCRDGIQFILQYRASPTAPNRWIGKSYPTTREGLRESIDRIVGKDACEGVRSYINALPDHIRE